MFDVVKCNLTKLTTKRCWFSCSSGFMVCGCLAVSSLRRTCTDSRRSCSLSVIAIWNHVGKSVVRPLF